MRLFVLLFSLFFFCSCSGEVPKGVMPPQKMEAVWYDILRADEWTDFARLQDSTFLPFSKRASLYDSLFRLHQISKEDYRKSMAFYQSRPDLLKEILQSLRTKSDTALKQLSDTTKRKTIKSTP